MSNTLLSTATAQELFLELIKRIPEPSAETMEGEEFVEIDSERADETMITIHLRPAAGEYVRGTFSRDGSLLLLEGACY